MEEVLAFASELGRLIARHERFDKLRAAEEAVYSDKETRMLLAAFEAQRTKVGELEAAEISEESMMKLMAHGHDDLDERGRDSDG